MESCRSHGCSCFEMSALRSILGICKLNPNRIAMSRNRGNCSSVMRSTPESIASMARHFMIFTTLSMILYDSVWISVLISGHARSDLSLSGRWASYVARKSTKSCPSSQSLIANCTKRRSMIRSSMRMLHASVFPNAITHNFKVPERLRSSESSVRFCAYGCRSASFNSSMTMAQILFALIYFKIRSSLSAVLRRPTSMPNASKRRSCSLKRLVFSVSSIKPFSCQSLRWEISADATQLIFHHRLLRG